MRSFDALGFSPAYVCEIDPRFPGNGDWGVPVQDFRREGASNDSFRSRWGTPLLVRVTPDRHSSWVGQAAAGGLGGVSGAFACPSDDALCLVVEGQVYLIDVREPGAYRPLLLGVKRVMRVEGLPLLMLVTDLDVTAVGAQGKVWQTGRLCLDELEIVSASSEGIVCLAYFGGSHERVVLDPETGERVSGPKFPW